MWRWRRRPAAHAARRSGEWWPAQPTRRQSRSAPHSSSREAARTVAGHGTSGSSSSDTSNHRPSPHKTHHLDDHHTARHCRKWASRRGRRRGPVGMTTCPRGPLQQSSPASWAFRPHVCSLSSPPLMLAHRRPSAGDEAALASARELHPSSATEVRAQEIVERDEPELLRNVWPMASSGWTWSRLRELFAGETLEHVVLSSGYQYLPADPKAALYPFLKEHHSPQSTHNMSADRVLDILEAAEALVEGSAADSPSRSCARLLAPSGRQTAALGGRPASAHGVSAAQSSTGALPDRFRRQGKFAVRVALVTGHAHAHPLRQRPQLFRPTHR